MGGVGVEVKTEWLDYYERTIISLFSILIVSIIFMFSVNNLPALRLFDEYEARLDLALLHLDMRMLFPELKYILTEKEEKVLKDNQDIIHLYFSKNHNFDGLTIKRSGGVEKLITSLDVKKSKLEDAKKVFFAMEKKSNYVSVQTYRHVLYYFIPIFILFSLMPISTSILGFRFKIMFYNFSTFLILLFAFYYIMTILFESNKNNYFAYSLFAPGFLLFYPFLSLCKGLSDSIVVLPLAINALFWRWLFSKILPGISMIKMLPCPNEECGILLNMKDNWYHKKCGDSQIFGRKTYFTSIHWFKCWKLLDEIVCPNCGRRIKL